jgi:membrane associated rhomboid family serine protease
MSKVTSETGSDNYSSSISVNEQETTVKEETTTINSKVDTFLDFPMQEARQNSLVLNQELEIETSPKSETHDSLLSQEPFSHPSSPIKYNANDSLTNENLHLLESLSLQLDDSLDKSKGDLESSYVSFISKTNSNSRANSIVSSAVTSHANNTTKRRKPGRPRPWDNYEEEKETVQYGHGKETTPLLASKTTSIHSMKTAKRNNKQHNGFTTSGDPYTTLLQDDTEAASPNLKWKGGVFTETEDNYGSIPSSRNYGLFSSQTFSLPFMMDRSNALNSDTLPHPICSSLIFMTAVHFMLMGLYNTLVHYKMHRMGEVSPPYWITKAGRIYNPNIGPNSNTLVLFGAFHPILGMNEWWRLVTGSICVTSIFELAVNLFLLRVMADYEERLGSWNFSWIFGWSVLAGALGSIMQMSGFWTVTGLSSAGIMGFMVAALVYDFISDVTKRKTDAHLTTRKSWSWPQLGIIMQIIQSFTLQYVSFSSMVASGIMGMFLGMSLKVPDKDWTDLDSNASSSVMSDLDDAFASEMNTPPRFGFDMSPPPPPSSSSKGGHDTPVMRRSIMSPDEDEEFDTRRSLNIPGGLKQRNTRYSGKTNKKNTMLRDGRDEKKPRNDLFCTETRLRFLGILGAMIFITVSMLYIGLIMRVPDEQTINDSIYGCITSHGIYTYEVSGDDDGNLNKNEEIINAGDTICGEICIPHSIYTEAIKGDAGSLDKGSCQEQSYACHFSSDAFDMGMLEIERDLYTFGLDCDNN